MISTSAHRVISPATVFQPCSQGSISYIKLQAASAKLTLPDSAADFQSRAAQAASGRLSAACCPATSRSITAPSRASIRRRNRCSAATARPSRTRRSSQRSLLTPRCSGWARKIGLSGCSTLVATLLALASAGRVHMGRSAGCTSRRTTAPSTGALAISDALVRLRAGADVAPLYCNGCSTLASRSRLCRPSFLPQLPSRCTCHICMPPGALSSLQAD